ncbi:MAG TPA: hypothetical protein VG452_01830 [Egibacteraceae bacterium]|nr:hypothetical protein [Egibacteraceae bacterium]
MIATPQRRRLRAALVGVAAAAALAAGAGVGVPGTFNAQTAADEPQYLLSAISLFEDGDLDIADELAAQRWRPFHASGLPEQTRPLPGGRRISPHDPLLPALLAVPMALGGWVAAKLTLAGVAAAVAAATLWTAVRRFDVATGPATLVVAVFSATSPLAAYGSQVYPELPGALLTVVAIAALTPPGPGAAGRQPAAGRSWPATAVVGAAVAALPWLAVKFVPVAAALAVLALGRLWAGAQRGRALALAALWASAGVGYLLAHQAVYGGWTPYASGDHFVGGELSVVGEQPNYAGRAQRLVGLVVDRRFGLAAWQPAWLLAIPAVGALARRRPPGWAVLGLPLAAGWLTATFVALTMQGFWFPGRQVVVVLPAAVLAVAWWAGRVPAARAAVAVTGLIGLWSYGWLVADGLRGRITWVVNIWQVADPWYGLWARVLPDYLLPTRWTGVQHALWLAAAVVLALLGARSAARG